MPVIELKNISNFICRNINLKIVSGELMVLLGPTGAGKTTLLNIVSGLIEKGAGKTKYCTCGNWNT